jgi:phage terminase small subunit
MPAHRKTIEAHALSGSLLHNPKRYADRQTEPRPAAPIGNAPSHLSTSAKKVWKEISKNAPEGSLGCSDRLILEVVCVLTVAFREGKLIKASEVSQLINGLGRLGLTPADRAKLNVEPPTKPTADDSDPLGFLVN